MPALFSSPKKDKPDSISTMAALDTKQKRHQFFVFACTNFEPSNYVCWACIQQYKKAPNKRKMIFIDTHFTSDTPVSGNAANVSQDMVEAYKILKFVNLGAEQIGNYQKSIGNKVNVAKSLKTFAQKKEFMGGGNMGAIKALLVKGMSEDPRAFESLESDLNSALTDFRHRFRFSQTYQMPAGTQLIIPETMRLLSEATFDPTDMGVY